MRRIAIIGASLTGLYTTWRLQEKGYEVTLFEGRDQIGRRIGQASLSVDPFIRTGSPIHVLFFIRTGQRKWRQPR
ncbi:MULTISPECIES: NAD(P)-binding protein [unclassified Exiguobacterium]|uniref:NAD(P)-binding protein n=1 Tax=Exiguobacterium TaxID=33986 RepID=UPI001BE8B703